WPRLPSGGCTHPVRDDSQHQAEAVYRNRIRPLDVLLQPRRSQERSRRPSTRHYVHRTQPVRPTVHCTWNSVDQKQVQNVDLTTFQKLERDDVLFIDSSHVLKIDGDVPFLYLEVLPSLSAGTVVHIHDVPFPYNIPYPPDLWVFQVWPVWWNEAMVVQSFLCF